MGDGHLFGMRGVSGGGSVKMARGTDWTEAVAAKRAIIAKTYARMSELLGRNPATLLGFCRLAHFPAITFHYSAVRAQRLPAALEAA